MSEFLGIWREPEYSPGKVEADRAILESVADHLRGAHRVRVAAFQDGGPEPTPQTVVFAMCQGPSALNRLREWEAAGIRVINSARAVANCHRERTVHQLALHGVPHPETTAVSTERVDAWPAWLEAGAWIKRGDVHAMQTGDVVRLGDPRAAAAVCADFQRRGIRTALLQRHMAGDVVKFYGVADAFFAAYLADDDCALPSGERLGALRAVAAAGAAALGLEIYGGDCVCGRDGRSWLIDINDWPSYGRCREAAAAAIAHYLEREAARS